jgi:hypothetical protein
MSAEQLKSSLVARIRASGRIKARGRLGIAACLLMLLTSAGQSQDKLANEAAKAPAEVRKMSTRFLPDSALLCFDIQPNAILTSPTARLIPTEVIEAVCDEQIGIQLDSIQFARVVMDMPGGPNAVDAAVVMSFNQDVKVEQLKSEIIDLDTKLEISSKTAYRLPTPEPMFLVPVSSRLWIIGTESYLPTVIDAAASESSSGRLAEIVSDVDMRGQLQLVVDLEPIKPLIGLGITSQAADIPPALSKMPELINHFDAAWTTVDLANPLELLSYGQFVLRVTDDDAADHVESVLKESLELLREDLVKQGQQAFYEDNKLNAAWRTYIQRVSLEVTPLVSPRREGRLFYGPSTDRATEIGTAGVVVGMLLPAVQAAREAARRMNASNGLKQIALAFHDYHDANKQLPAPAIIDADGKPLLSWRVALLPYIEQQELYDQFHLDEPWDSEHNLTLVDKMPMAFVDPSYLVRPGETVFQVAMGPDMAFTNNTEEPGFRDFLDGTANTILAYESSMASADIWTKPPELTMDMDDPFAQTGDIHPGGFHVMMSDGAVNFVTYETDIDLFRSMLTRAKGD